LQQEAHQAVLGVGSCDPCPYYIASFLAVSDSASTGGIESLPYFPLSSTARNLDIF